MRLHPTMRSQPYSAPSVRPRPLAQQALRLAQEIGVSVPTRSQLGAQVQPWGRAGNPQRPGRCPGTLPGGRGKE